MLGEAFERFGLRRRAFRVLGFQCRVLGVEVLGLGIGLRVSELGAISEPHGIPENPPKSGTRV